MFNLFKKTAPINVFNLLEKVFKELPTEYNTFYSQIKSNFNGIRFEKKTNSNYIEFRHDPSNFKIFEKLSERDYMLKGVYLIDNDKKNVIELTIYVSAGMVMGVSTSKSIKDISDMLEVKYEKLTKRYLQDIPDVKLANIFTEKQLQIINPSEVYEVELDGKLFYHVRDLADGDFIGVDTDKKVYRITHDPYEIKEIGNDISEIIKNHAQ